MATIPEPIVKPIPTIYTISENFSPSSTRSQNGAHTSLARHSPSKFSQITKISNSTINPKISLAVKLAGYPNCRNSRYPSSIVLVVLMHKPISFLTPRMSIKDSLITNKSLDFLKHCSTPSQPKRSTSSRNATTHLWQDIQELRKRLMLYNKKDKNSLRSHKTFANTFSRVLNAK